ncbi:Tm-1-like ATP-binding domain-containing protein [Modestobacter altitudinis]|uniref:Tm-1-like ATP-binding domain-containing protein n=1 Tax=Modestobacter altitudinis TaxID=2213158 RepID=UPI00110CF337|nr:Tm-1-like ATP-binding domain-containing protein [Modestobacter altitudinis]
MSTPTVVLVGTLDTKGEEYAFLRDRLHQAGVATVVVDVGTQGPPRTAPDVTRAEVAAAGGFDLAGLTDRGTAVAAMCSAAPGVVRRLYEEGRCQGVLAAGGSGNTAIATAAMRALPVGVPKLVVSTMASGDTAGYVDVSDVTLMPAVTDVAGLNSVSGRILANAAAAMAGMVSAPPLDLGAARPVVAATMFGVTTPAVTTAREELERRGYEVLVFHATGTGGRSMEGLVEAGYVIGVLDLTTTELADDLVGGVLSAGPHRLEAAGRRGVPQVVSLGALDMVNFGPRESVPARFADRTLYVHNPSITLMRTTPEECAELGRRVGTKLSAATGPVALFVPLRGISALAGADGPFFDAEADAALLAGLRETLAPSVELHELDAHVNDPEFAVAMAARLDEFLGGTR